MGRVTGLRFRLLLLVFLAALPAVSLLLFSAAEERWLGANEVKQEALRYARLAAIADEQLFQGTRQLLVAVAQLPEAQGDDAIACSALLARLLKQYPMYTNLGVAGADGRVFATALSRPETSYSDRDWFRRVLETRDFVVSGYLQGRNTGKAVLGVGYPLLDAAGQVRRVVFTALDLGAIGLVAATADLPEGGTIAVTDGAGTILARYPDNGKWVGQSSPVQRLSSTGQDESVSEGPGVDGVTRLYGYTRLKATDIRVNVGMPLDAIYAPVNRMLTRNLLLLAGATGLMCALAWGLGQALLVGPVGRLRQTARRLAAGDLTARAGLANSGGELGELALSLDRMADSLQEQQAGLMRLNRFYSVLSQTDEAIVRTREPHKLYEEVCRIAVEQAALRMAWVGLVDAETRRLKPVASAGFVAGHLDDIQVSLDETTPAGRGPTGIALREGRIVTSADVTRDERMVPWREAAMQRGYRSFAALPLRAGGQTLGALMLYSDEPSFFEHPEEARLLDTLAADISFAIESALQEQRRAAAESQLQDEQAALRESEARFRTYMDHSPTFAFMNGAEGRILYHNSVIERFYGIAPEGWKGKSLLDYHPAERVEEMLADDRRVLDTGESLTAVEQLQAVDGSWHDWLTYKFPLRDASGQTYVGGVSVDVTEQRKAEAALRQYAERLNTLHRIDQAILAAESPEQIARAALERISQLVPCQRASVVAFDAVAQRADLMAVVADGATAVAEGSHLELSAFGSLDDLNAGRTVRYDDLDALLNPSPVVEVLRREGLRSYLMIPLRAGGELVGYLGVGAREPRAFGPRDEEIAGEVADQLAVAYRQARLHEQVERHAAELETRVAERTASLEEINQELKSFAYSVSHDLHAPLRAMQGFAQALMEDYSGVLDETGQEYARRIVLASERLDRLINDLLAYSRLSRADLPLQPVELATVVDEALGQIESDLESSGARVTTEEPLPWVIGHPATLVQVVVNLVGNALKFVAPNVTPEVHLRTEKRGERWRLWVEDNGIGIAPEHQERVFRIFERLHGAEAYPGTGIGLALVRRAAERMGGRVGIESNAGQGSRFWLELPGVGRTT
jgi:PAS domain S-box-containing protein